MAFQVSRSSHNSRTKHYFANRVKIQENMTRSLYKLLLALRWSLSSCSSLHRQTHRHTNVYLACACAHQGIITAIKVVTHTQNTSLCIYVTVYVAAFNWPSSTDELSQVEWDSNSISNGGYPLWLCREKECSRCMCAMSLILSLLGLPWG